MNADALFFFGGQEAAIPIYEKLEDRILAAIPDVKVKVSTLAVSLGGKVRVNSISPGWIDTNYTVYEGPDAGRVGNPLDIANMVLFLCSEKAGFITGENICIDGGQTKLMIYHNDFGWTYNPGMEGEGG